ncbi:carbonic anhydrase part 2, authentic frameshift [Pyrobaculum aerophilum str. IM2]|uniref:Carbonic anhydrase part 2, authentic frameshift n=1 Tax=Pyrobaculum aerophilum (strain ATCC 51768 / DSM 7523 / JCM 9630 / CIP 104966 / NBRC 100827 / IM2) TaxID=178306 RepID=Q8ZSM6_PYRAE
MRKAEVENVKIACEKLRELWAEVEGYYYDLDGPALIPVCKSP